MSALQDLLKSKTSPTTSKKSGGSALSQLVANVQTPQPQNTDIVKKATIPAWLGGGAYNIGVDKNKVINTGHTNYGGEKTQTGKQRDDIIPVGLGGDNSSPANIRLENLLTGNTTPTDPIEKQAINDYKAGKITLAGARLQVMTAKQQQTQPLKTTTKGNFLSSLSDLIQLPLKKTADFAVKNALQPVADVFNETIGERIGAVGRSIQGKSLTPLKESFKKQLRDLNPYEPGISNEESLRRLSNIALSANLDAGLNIKGLRENTPLQSGRPKIEPSDIQKNPVVANLENQVSKAQELQPKFPSDTQGGALENLAKTTSRQEKVGSQVNKLDTTYSKGIPQIKEPVKVETIPNSEFVTAHTPVEIKPIKIEAPKLSDNIVKPPTVRGKLESPQLDFTKWKDTNPIGLARETFDRNIERVAGTDAPKLKQFITEPIRANETRRVEFLNNTRKEIRTLMKDTGIKAGSKEDALIQRYGEGNITLQDLKAETPKWQEVQKSSDFFRQKYDNLLSMVNAERENFGYKPIPKRADYFRHFEEINNVISQMGVLFRENDLPTHLSGITNIFKPGKPFSTAELARKGGAYTESAIKGMDNYIEAISKQAFHIDSVQRVRALEKYIRTAGEAGQAKLPNFVANISEYANLIAGKKALLDRAVESIMGRKSFSVLSGLKNRFSSNTVVGNISSALTNFIPLTTQFPATTGKKQVAQGLYEAFISPFLKNPLSIGDVKSGFLTRRFPDAAIVGQKIFGSSALGKGAEYASSLFNAVDFFTARSVVAGKYYENIAKGLDSKVAMQQADDYAAKLIADRSIGQTPNLFNTKTLGVVTQFQLEVNNMVSFALRDIPNMSKGSKLKLASQLGQFVLYSYLFNTVFEQMTGRRPTIDPIQSILQTIGQTKDTKGMPVKPRLSKAGKDLAGNLPFGNIFVEGGRLPIASALPNIGGLLKGDTTLSKEGIKILTYIVSPFGGSQIKKSIEGVSAFNKGGVTDTAGKKQFDIPKTPVNFARTSVFGKYSVPNASQYFDSKAIKATQPKKAKTTKEKKPVKAKTFKY